MPLYRLIFVYNFLLIGICASFPYQDTRMPLLKNERRPFLGVPSCAMDFFGVLLFVPIRSSPQSAVPPGGLYKLRKELGVSLLPEYYKR